MPKMPTPAPLNPGVYQRRKPMLKRSIRSAAAALALLALPGTAMAGPGVCDSRFQPDDPMIKFCQGLNVGIGDAEIRINSIVVSTDASSKSGAYCRVRAWSASSLTNDWIDQTFYVGKCLAQFSRSPAPVSVPVYVSGHDQDYFFDALVGQAFGRTLPDNATFLVTATKFDGKDDADGQAIAIAIAYKTAGTKRKYGKLEMGMLCPDPISGQGRNCKMVSAQANEIVPLDADPNGWDAYQILYGSGQSRLVKVTFGFDVGGGSKAFMSWQEFCRPTSLYVQSARAHFNLIPHPSPGGVTVDFCACSSYDSAGQCN